MVIACPDCSMRFQYDESRFVGAPSKNFQCTECGAIFDVVNPFRLAPGEIAPPPPFTLAEPPQAASLQKGGKVSLAFLSGPKSSTSVELTNPKTVIGRDEGDVATMDPETSRRHAMIEIAGDGTVWLHDLGSTNGTITNGGLITAKAQLFDRQEFTCGKSSFMLLLEPISKPPVLKCPRSG